MGIPVVTDKPEITVLIKSTSALLVERIGANAGGNVERRIPPERVGKTERKDMKATAIRDHGRA